MQVSCDEGVANHIGLESCVVHREVWGEALTKGCTGQPLSRERTLFQGADAVILGGRQDATVRYASTDAALRGHRTWHVHTLLEREPEDLRIDQQGLVRDGKAPSRSRR